MTSSLYALAYDANDPVHLAQFWGSVLRREADGATLLPSDDLEFPIRFVQNDEPRTEPNQMHFDLPSDSSDAQVAMVERVLSLGGVHYDAGQLPEEEHVPMADPEGNEFCVIEAGNNFLADTGSIGCLAGDGTAAVGRFWSQALSWPLVWDTGEETAIQSPQGGSKISWGGPPVAVRSSEVRLHFDLAPGGDQQAEVERFVSLGATPTHLDACEDGWVAMADPDGNPFCVTEPSAQ